MVHNKHFLLLTALPEWCPSSPAVVPDQHGDDTRGGGSFLASIELLVELHVLAEQNIHDLLLSQEHCGFQLQALNPEYLGGNPGDQILAALDCRDNQDK